MVCEGFALRDLLMEIAPPKQEEEKVPSWDAVRKEDTWKIGPSSGKSKQEMQGELRKICQCCRWEAGMDGSSHGPHCYTKNEKDTDLDTEWLPRGENVEFTGCLQQQKNAEVAEGLHVDSNEPSEVDEDDEKVATTQ